MSLLFLLLTLFLLVLLKITSEAMSTGFDIPFGFSLEQFQNGGSGELLIAKAEWCGHCQTAKPEFNKLMQLGSLPMKSGGSLNVRVLDSEKDSEEIKALNIQGFPTIMAKIGEKIFEYSGDRNAEAVKDFVSGLSA